MGYNEKLENIAKKIMKLSQNTILVNLRYMDASLSYLENSINYNIKVCTDGKTLYYNPKYIITLYKYEENLVKSLFIHSILHCVFKHFYINSVVNQDLWDLSCDIAVEAIVCNLNEPCFEHNKRAKQREIISELKKDIKMLTAEKIYNYFTDKNYTEEDIFNLHRFFMMDEHQIWYVSNSDKKEMLGAASSQGNSSEENKSKPSDELDSGNDGNSKKDDNSLGNNLQNNANNYFSYSQEILDNWLKISQRMQTDLETRSKKQGDTAGNMLQNLKAVNREKYDYSKFLKKFSTLNEVMKLNLDEFDYGFYTYGLNLYKNMPLVEPLEYKDVKIIKEFVIAIDTSGSVQGDLVQKFIQKTYNILKQEESFLKKINLRIIQCDTVIQEDVKITSQLEFDEYIENMTLKGFGGTDFRPVFEHIDKLIEKKELVNLKGVLYFTDGFGEYPTHKPKYHTAFILVEEDDEAPEVPIWAIKLVVHDEEI